MKVKLFTSLCTNNTNNVFYGTLTSSQLKNNIRYPSKNGNFPDGHHGNADSGVDVSATKMQAAHGQCGNAKPKAQRNQLRGRRMEWIPCDGGASGQENKKESRYQFHESTCPEVNTFQLWH